MRIKRLLLFLFALLMFAIPARATTATFLGIDTTTKGNYILKYGADGYIIPNNGGAGAGYGLYTVHMPTYVQFTQTGVSTYIWASSSTDPRALLVANVGVQYLGTMYTSGTYVLDINLTDGKNHTVALYGLDWNGYNGNRNASVTVKDANTGTVLDTRGLSYPNYQTTGIWLSWSVVGHIQIVVTNLLNNSNATVAGVFFSTPPAPQPTPPAPPTGGFASTASGPGKLTVSGTCNAAPCAMTFDSGPNNPVTFNFTSTTHSVALSWTASTSQGVNGYQVFRSGTSGSYPSTPLGSTSGATTYTDATVAAGTQYFYVIQAYAPACTSTTPAGTACGNSANSNEIGVTIPSP